MAKYRKRPIVIEAVQWPGFISKEISQNFHIVRHRIPIQYNLDKCQYCKFDMYCHGEIPTLEGTHIVCPNDWIITGIKGEVYPCKPDIFEATYEPVGDSPTQNG